MANISGFQKDYIKAFEELSKDGTNVSGLLMLTEMSYEEKENLSEYKSDESLKSNDYYSRIDRCFNHLLSTFFKINNASNIYDNYKELFNKSYLDNTDDDTNDYEDETMIKLNKIYNFINKNDKNTTGTDLLSSIRKEITGVDEEINNWYFNSIFDDLKYQSDIIKKEKDLKTKMALVPMFLKDMVDMESYLFRHKQFEDDYRKSVTGLMNYLLLRAELPLIYIKPIELDEYYSYIDKAEKLYDQREIISFYQEKMCDSIENCLIKPMKDSIKHFIDTEAQREAGLIGDNTKTFKQNKYVR